MKTSTTADAASTAEPIVEILNAAGEVAETTTAAGFLDRCLPGAKPCPPVKPDRELLLREFARIWDPKMTRYCAERAAAVALLPSGLIVCVNKRQIEKDFCFGESGYDMDEAVEMANHARTSERYFKHRNMEWFADCIEKLSAALYGSDSFPCGIVVKIIRSRDKDDCRIASFDFMRLTDLISAVGPVRLDEVYGMKLSDSIHLATREEMAILLEAVRFAAKDHEKKVDAYLKRYGTSKVRSWTYWRDA